MDVPIHQYTSMTYDATYPHMSTDPMEHAPHGYAPSIPIVSEIPPPVQLPVVELPPPDFFSPITRVLPVVNIPPPTAPIELPPPPSTATGDLPKHKRVTKKQQRLQRRADKVARRQAEADLLAKGNEMLLRKRKRYTPRPIKPLPQQQESVKRNWPPYMFFCKIFRDRVSNANPGIRSQTVTRILSSMWREVSAEERKIFEELALKDRERYFSERVLESTNPDDVANEKPKKKRVKRDPNAPKRNKSAYLWFANERRSELQKENPDLSFVEITKMCSSLWKGMSEDEKLPWNEKAAEDKRRYYIEKQKFMETTQTTPLEASFHPAFAAPPQMHVIATHGELPHEGDAVFDAGMVAQIQQLFAQEGVVLDSAAFNQPDAQNTQ